MRYAPVRLQRKKWKTNENRGEMVTQIWARRTCNHHQRHATPRQVWAHVYGRDNLNVAPEDHAVLVTEAPLNPYKNRRECAETFFENFGVPAMFCAPQVRELCAAAAAAAMCTGANPT